MASCERAAQSRALRRGGRSMLPLQRKNRTPYAPSQRRLLAGVFCPSVFSGQPQRRVLHLRWSPFSYLLPSPNPSLRSGQASWAKRVTRLRASHRKELQTQKKRRQAFALHKRPALLSGLNAPPLCLLCSFLFPSPLARSIKLGAAVPAAGGLRPTKEKAEVR